MISNHSMTEDAETDDDENALKAFVARSEQRDGAAAGGSAFTQTRLPVNLAPKPNSALKPSSGKDGDCTLL